MKVCPECRNQTRLIPCSTCQPFYHSYLMQDKAANALAPKTTSANTKQFGGDHYVKIKGIQPWDYIVSNNMGFLEGCIIKYVSRYQDKGGIEDLKKAQHFLEKLIEVKEKQ